MDDIEELKKRKMEELQNQMQAQVQEEAQVQAQVQQLEAVVKSKMTKDAVERYGNLKIAHPEKAIQALVVLAQMIQTGKLDQINDTYLKEVLKNLTPEKREFRLKKR